MPLTKTYCKGTGLVVRHNDTLDLSTNSANWANNCAGSSLGATPEDDRGWSYPTVSGWTSSSIDPTIRAEYPSVQMPTFRDHSTVIKRPADSFSQKHKAWAKYPWYSGGSNEFYPRSESYTANGAIKNKADQCFRFSVYKPTDQAYDQFLEAIIFQWHGGSGNPPFSFMESAGGELSVYIHNGTGTQNQVNIFLGAFTKGVWHEFIVFIKFSQTKSIGQILIFKDGKIARTRVRSGSSGSYLFTQGPVPKVTGTTNGITNLNTDLLGDLPLNTAESGTPDLMYYEGITLGAAQTLSSIYPKWGIYKYPLKSYYKTASATVTRLGAGDTLEEAILLNSSDPLEDKYILPELREMTLHTSVSFGYVGSGETYEQMFLLLSDGVAMDADERALIASEPELSWFTLNPTAPPVTEYTLTVTAGTGGAVSSAGGLYESGDPVSLIATSDEGYYFLDWINVATGTTVSVLATYSFNMPASNLSLRARFSLITVPPEPGSSQRFFCKKPVIIV